MFKGEYSLRVLSNTIIDNCDALAVGDLGHTINNVFLRVEDHMFGTIGACDFGLLGRGRRADDSCSNASR